MTTLLALPIFLIILICVGAFIIHFLPTIIALSRKAENTLWIVVINFFFGWTLIGWVATLIWACVDRPRYMVGYIQPPYNR